MIAFPNAKINLGLNITSKRSDGYHNLETVFFPIPLKDVLEVIQAEEFSFKYSGLTVQGDIKDNLCVKAYNLLKADFPDLPDVSIYLHKVIPMGAGLGGGSADGAFMLHLLSKKFHLKVSEDKLLDYSLQLGSDCPFFIINEPCFATGRGEDLTPIELDLSAYKILLINPKIHVSTKDAFAELSPKSPERSIQEIIKKPVEDWKDLLINDFERTVFQKHREIEDIKKTMYASGAVYASMTGTGSTVYGIFYKDAKPTFSFPQSYLQLSMSLQ